jgi:hypothetical protein
MVLEDTNAIAALSARSEQLKYNLKFASYSIREHFLNIKSDIDAQAETLIGRIQEKRLELFHEIEEHERKTLAKFTEQFDQTLFDQILAEAATTDHTQTDRNLKKIDETIKYLEKIKFSDNLMVFENSLDVCLDKSIDRLFGALVIKPVSSQNLVTVSKSNGIKYDFSDKNLLPYNKLCDSGNMKANSDCNEFLRLKNGKYFHIQRYYRRNLRIGVFSENFASCLASRNLIKIVNENFSLPCVCVHGNNLVLCLEDHSNQAQPRTLVLIFDEQLNKTREALIDGIFFGVVANASYVLLLYQNKLMNRILVNVYDWTLSFCFTIDSDDMQSRYTLRHVDVDDANRLVLQYRDAFHVTDIEETGSGSGARPSARKHFLKMDNRRKSNFITFKIVDANTLCLLETPSTLVFIDMSTCDVVRELRVDLDFETGNSNSQYSLKILDICKDRVVIFDPVSNSVQVFSIDESSFKI